jgi:hypothetical protein
VVTVPDITVCGHCGDTRLKTVLDLGDQPLAERDDGNSYPLCVLQCLQCGLAQLSFAVPREDVFRPGHPYATGNTAALRSHFAALAVIAGDRLSPGELIADIGANDGTFLAAVRSLGLRVRLLGIEPTRQAVACRARGVPAENAPFTAKLARDLARLHGPAQVITASNVLAHVADPHDFMTGVGILLSSSGTFIAECHDWAAVVNGLQVDAVYHEHLRYYTPATLGHLLEMHGFLVSSAEAIPVHGGSFRMTAVRQHSEALQVRAGRMASGLHALVARAREDGPVYGISAATRATGLIGYAGLAPYLDRVCEVPGSAKIGMTVPGTVIPVTDERDLIADQPPHALLFCWHIAASVAPKLRAAGYRGRFIVPLPEPRVVSLADSGLQSVTYAR